MLMYLFDVHGGQSVGFASMPLRDPSESVLWGLVMEGKMDDGNCWINLQARDGNAFQAICTICPDWEWRVRHVGYYYLIVY